MMSYLLIALYSMGIISIYSIGNGFNKLVPIVTIFSIYTISIISLNKKNKIHKMNYIELSIFLFILLVIIQGIIIFPQNSLGAFKYMALPFIFIISIFCSEKQIIKLFSFLRLLGVFCVIYGIIEFITGNNIFFSYMNLESAYYKKQFELNGMVRVSTIFGHPIVYGTFLICLFWIIYFLYDKRKLKLSEKMIIALIIINLGLTQSRSSWITFVITIIIYYLPKLKLKISKIKKKTLFRCITVAIGLIIMHESVFYVFDLLIDRFNDIFTSDGKASLLQRVGAIDLVIGSLSRSSFLEIMFGKGVFSTVDLLKNNIIFLQGFTSIDNQYLTLLYENGLTIIILYLIIFIGIFLTNLQSNQNSNISKISYFIFYTISINMFFYEAISIKWYSISMLLFIALGVLSKNLKYIRREKNINEGF